MKATATITYRNTVLDVEYEWIKYSAGTDAAPAEDAYIDIHGIQTISGDDIYNILENNLEDIEALIMEL